MYKDALRNKKLGDEATLKESKRKVKLLWAWGGSGRLMAQDLGTLVVDWYDFKDFEEYYVYEDAPTEPIKEPWTWKRLFG